MRSFRIVAATEATTFIVLLSALIWRTAFDGPDLASTTGPIHGIAFVAYFVAVVQIRDQQEWSAGTTAKVLGAAVIPLAGYFVADRFLNDTRA